MDQQRDSSTVSDARMRERFWRVLISPRDAIWHWDIEGGRFEVDASLAQRLGYTPGALNDPKAFQRAIHPDDLPTLQRGVDAFFASGLEQYDWPEHRLIGRAGDEHWFVMRAMLTRDAEGKPVRMDGVHIDVGERHAATARVERYTQQFQQLIDLLPHAVFVRDEQGRFVLANRATGELFGCAPTEMLGRPLMELHHDISQVQYMLEGDRLITSGTYAHIDGEESFTLADGTLRKLRTARVAYEHEGRPAVLGIAADVTVQRRREREASEANEHFRLLAENVPGVIYLCRNDARYTMLFLSDAVEALTGYTKKQFLDDEVSFVDLYHPDDAEQIVTLVDAALERRESFHLNYRIRHRDGGWRWIAEEGVGVFHDDKLEYLEGFLQDTTERHEAEAALHESEYRRNIALEAGAMGTWDVDLTTGDEVWDEQLERLFGLKPGGFDGRQQTFYEYVHPDDLDAVQKANVHSAATGADFDLPFRIIRADGAVRWMAAQARILRDEKGDTSRMIGVCRDITESKTTADALEEMRSDLEQRVAQRTDELVKTNQRLSDEVRDRREAEHALRREESRFRSLLAALPDVVMVLDAQGRYLEVFTSRPELLLRPRVQLLKRTIHELLDTEEAKAVQRVIDEVLRDQKSITLDYELTIRGERRYFSARVVPYREEASPAVLWVARDVTEQRLVEIELSHSRELYENAQRIAHLGYFERDFEKDTVSWSNETYRIFGMDPESFDPGFDSFLTLVHPDDRAHLRELVSLAMDHGQSFDSEYRAVLSDGEVRVIHCLGEPRLNDNGERTILTGTIHDITEQKQAEQALRESEERFRLHFHNNPTPIYCWQRRGDKFVLSDFNDAARAATDNAVTGFIGRTVEEQSKAFPQVVADFEQCYESQTTTTRQVSFQDKHGQTQTLALRLVPVPPDLIMLHAEDITDRQRAAEAIAASREEEMHFRNQLTTLNSISNRLSLATTRVELCREAVTAGVRELEVDRLSIWFRDVDPAYIVGTFGTDEQGRVRDERASRLEFAPSSMMGRVLLGEGQVFHSAASLLDDHAQRAGEGEQVVAALSDGDQVFGALSADNLITQQPFSQRQVEVLKLYAATIGHLCSRLQAMEAKRASDERVQAIIDNSTAVIYVKDTEGRYLLINRQFERLFNVTFGDVRGRNDFDLFSAEVAEAVRANDARVLARGEAVEFEEVVPHDNQNHTYISVKFPLYDAAGQVYALCGISTDISDRKRAEEQLRQSEARYRLLADHTTDIIFRESADGRILYASPACETLLGYDPAELIDRNSLDYVHLDDIQSVLEVRELLALAGTTVTSYRMYRRDGQYLWVESTSRAVRDEAGRMREVVTVTRDISERKHAEEALRRSERLASVGTLAAGIAHEINNPLGAIVFSATAARNAAGDPSRRKSHDEAIAQIVNDANRCAAIVKNVLQFARHEKTLQEPHAITDAIARARELVSIAVKDSSMDITVAAAASLPAVMINVTEIEQVLVNCMINAIQAQASHLRITARYQSDVQRVVVAVRDDGRGMNETQKERAFDPFFTGREKEGGTGLGLSISHGIIHAHGGEITIDSEVGKGTTVTFSLPVAQQS